MYLRDLAVYTDETIVSRFPPGFVGWFHRETCCITELFVSLLWRKVSTPDTAKVNLVLVGQEGPVPSVRQFLNVADARWPFRFSAYAEENELGKKSMILDSLQAALLWIAEVRRWDSAGIEECVAEIISRGLNYEGWSKTSWASPSRKFRARIGFTFELRAVHFFVGVFDTRGRETGRKPLFTTVPEIGVADSVLKSRGRWVATNSFRLMLSDSWLGLPTSKQVDLSGLVT
jgi:hypothetical protein